MYFLLLAFCIDFLIHYYITIEYYAIAEINILKSICNLWLPNQEEGKCQRVCR